MAITTRAIVGASVKNAPTGYTARTAFTGVSNQVYFQRDEPIASIPNADAATGFDALLTALETHITGTYGPTELGLDGTDTIDVNYNISQVELVNTAASIFVTPVWVYRVSGQVEWGVS